MRLYFLRHVDALDGADDDLRPLSEKGERQCEILGRFLRANEVRLDRAYCSPLVRARDTVSHVLEAASLEDVPTEIVTALRNETSPVEFRKWLLKIPSEDILLVGHMPTLAERAAELLGLRSELFSLPKGGLVVMETEDRKVASLEYFVSPKILKSLG